MSRLKLSTRSDGWGFLYGTVERDGQHVRVDVLPPDHLWRGDIKLEGQMPDPKAWVLQRHRRRRHDSILIPCFNAERWIDQARNAHGRSS